MGSENRAISIGILIVNIIVVSVLLFLLCYVIFKCYKTASYEKDHKFFSFKLAQISVYFIANTCALYVNYIFFFIHHFEISGALMWLRYIDRTSMCILSWYLLLECVKYTPSMYDTLTD